MLCGCIASSSSKKILTFSIEHYPGKNAIDDSLLVSAYLEELCKADMIVGWYSGGFDSKFLITKCVEHRLMPPALPPELDLWVTPYKDWLLYSNRLDNVQEFLNLPDSKTKIWKKHWRLARTGNKESLQYIVKHCQKDVKVLKQAYYEMRPYLKNHPTLTLQKGGTCPVCLIGELAPRNFRYKKSGKYRRYQCKNCKHWSQDTRRTEGVTIVPV